MKTFVISIKLFAVLTIITGILYPLLITAIAQLGFSSKANGSLIQSDNRKIGSGLIGQQFDSSIYFTSRPSHVSYNPLPSGGSNYGMTNSKLIKLVSERRVQFILSNHLDSLAVVPSEMLFASASGLDPHISRKAAELQIDRVSKARNFTTDQKQKLQQCVNDLTEPPQFFCLGEERINVLLLNLETDKIK